jgi:hypothetical protein
VAFCLRTGEGIAEGRRKAKTTNQVFFIRRERKIGVRTHTYSVLIVMHVSHKGRQFIAVLHMSDEIIILIVSKNLYRDV